MVPQDPTKLTMELNCQAVDRFRRRPCVAELNTYLYIRV